MTWIDCTRTLRPGMIQWPEDTPFELGRVADMEEGDSANVTMFRGSVHLGTHVDAPRHFIRDGRAVADLPLEVLCGPASVVQVTEPRDVEPQDFEQLAPEQLRRVLFRTNNEALWNQASFDREFTAISPAAAGRLVELGTRLVGIDYASVDRYAATDRPVHQILCGADVIILENVDLSQVAPGRYELIALPIKLAEAEGAPARVILRPGS